MKNVEELKTTTENVIHLCMYMYTYVYMCVYVDDTRNCEELMSTMKAVYGRRWACFGRTGSSYKSWADLFYAYLWQPKTGIKNCVWFPFLWKGIFWLKYSI